MVLDVFHTNDGGCSKTELREYIASKFRCEQDNIQLFGFHTKFGGGRTSGFALIYDNRDSIKLLEKKYFEQKYQINQIIYVSKM